MCEQDLATDSLLYTKLMTHLYSCSVCPGNERARSVDDTEKKGIKGQRDKPSDLGKAELGVGRVNGSLGTY